MASEVGENYEGLLKEMETLKSRLEEERLKLNDVACISFVRFLKWRIVQILVKFMIFQYQQFHRDLRQWGRSLSNLVVY